MYCRQNRTSATYITMHVVLRKHIFNINSEVNASENTEEMFLGLDIEMTLFDLHM